MERYDMYCQVCNKNIYNALVDWMFSKHYECPQIYDNWEKIKEVYPRTRFLVKLKKGEADVSLLDSSLSQKLTVYLVKHIQEFLKNNGRHLTHFCEGIRVSVDSIIFNDKSFFEPEHVPPFSGRSPIPDSWKADKESEGMIIWYEDDEEEAYYKQAGLILHPPHSHDGNHVVTYNICPDCAKKLAHKCNLCGRKMKVENH